MTDERMVDEFHERIEELEKEVARLTKHLHDQLNAMTPPGPRGHPDYAYQTVEIGRKSGVDPEDYLEGEGWEPNGEDHDSWERFEWTEYHYFRRLKINE